MTDEREGDLFEGDIILSISEKRHLLKRFIRDRVQKRVAVEDDQEGSGSGEEPELTKDKRWPGGRVPYKMDDNLGECALQACTSAQSLVQHFTTQYLLY